MIKTSTSFNHKRNLISIFLFLLVWTIGVSVSAQSTQNANGIITTSSTSYPDNVVPNLRVVSACENGTLLFKEDFGGNDPNDIEIMTNANMNALFGSKIIGYTANQNPAGPNRYSVRKKGQSNATWVHMDDHTYPYDYTRGYFLQVDGENNQSGQFYKTQIDDICVGATLYFSMWATSISIGMPLSNLSMIIEDLNGNELTSFKAVNIPIAGDNNTYSSGSQITDLNNCNDWTQYSTTFTNTGSTSSIIFKIMNNNTGYMGNDFAIDDIEIYLCTPPVEITAPAKVCVGDPIEITSNFTNDGTFSEPLEYRWLKSTTGDLTSQSSWQTVGTDSDKLTIDPSTKADEGYYRLAVGDAASINLENCRAMSDPVFVFVKEDCTISSPCTNTTTNLQATICRNDTYTDNGFNLAQQTTKGLFTHQLDLLSSLGCDSTLILKLRVLSPDVIYLYETISEGDSYLFAGQELAETGVYSDMLTNTAGCDSIVYLSLQVNKSGNGSAYPFEIEPPQAFSPNGDGMNDEFKIIGLEAYPNNTIVIFNRWGNKVFEGTPYLNNWDGTSNLGLRIGGDELPVGTYFYILNVENSAEVIKGFVYLNR